MLVKRRRGWEMPERSATPESVYLDRRTLLKAQGGRVKPRRINTPTLVAVKGNPGIQS